MDKPVSDFRCPGLARQAVENQSADFLKFAGFMFSMPFMVDSPSRLAATLC